MLKYRRSTHSPEKLNAAGAVKLGTNTNVFELPTDNPIEEIVLTVCFTVGTALTLLGVDNILNIAKRIQVLTNNGKTTPRWDTSGIGALELVANEGMNLDRATLEALRISQLATVAAGANIRVSYRLPMVHPGVVEPLRTRMLYPVHTHKEVPRLVVDFSSLAEMASAGTITAMVASVQVIAKVMPAEVTAAVMNRGGFIDADVVESSVNFGVGAIQEARIPIQLTGSYTGLLLRLYKGGATISRDVIDEVTTPGAETIWSLITNLETLSQFRMRELQTENDWTKTANVLSLTTSPGFGGVVAANTSFVPSGSVMLDFLSLGLDARELGSVLDVNPQALATPTTKMELVGKPANTVTNGHTVFVIGRRLYGDLAEFKKLAI